MLSFPTLHHLLVTIILALSSIILNAQQITCTFNQSPTTSLYNCGSTVIANFNMTNLGQMNPQPNLLELYYPLQFDMIRINTINVSYESVYAINGSLYQPYSFIDPSIPGSPATDVTLKRVGIQLSQSQLSSSTLQIEFAVNTCEGTSYPNLDNTSLHPMLFDVTATNTSNTIELAGIFTQQVQLFNSSGVMKFPTLLPNAATLSTNEPFPSFSQPLAVFDREFNLTIQGNQFNSINISLALEEDAVDMGFFVVPNTNNPNPIGINQTEIIDQITGQHTYNYTVTRTQLLQWGYQFTQANPAVITFRHRAKIDCPEADDILVTSINATVDCIIAPNCQVTQTNTLLWNKTFPLNRPIQVTSHEVFNGTCNNGNIVNNEYVIKFNLPQSNNEVKVDYLDMPFVNSDFNVTGVAVSGLNGAGETLINNPTLPQNPRWEIISSQTLRIWISRLPGNFSAWPGIISESGAFKTAAGAYIFEIHVTFDFKEEMFKNCVGNSIAGISPYSQSNNYASLKFSPLCVDNSLPVIVNANIPNRINIPNQNYILSGGVASPDFTTLLNPDNTLDFNYSISTSGSQNPLAFFSNGNSVGLCANNSNNLTYQFVFKNSLSSLDGTNLLSLNGGTPIYLTSSNIIATINGFSETGIFQGDQITFDIPQGAFSPNFNNTIQIHFSLTLNRCPFDGLVNPDNESIGFAGAAEFEAEYRVSCSDCPDFYRTLTCIGGDESFGSYVVFQCIGECNYPIAGTEGAQTASFNAERISFGWKNETHYKAYLLDSNSPANKPFNCKTELVNTTLNWEGLTPDEVITETKKLYPYDLLFVKSVGTYAAPSDLISQISFEIATNRYEGTAPNTSFLELIPGSAFIRVAGQGTFSDFPLSDQVDIDPNATLSFGALNNQSYPDAINIDIDVHLLTLNPASQALQSYLNTLTSTAEISFFAVFRVHPEITLLTNPFGLDPLSTIKPITLRGQFMTSFENSQLPPRGSCETYGEVIEVLIPGAVVHAEAENVLSESIDLPIDQTNTSISTFDCDAAQLNNRCNSNIAYGIHLFGGFGPTHHDFIEYRPFLNWQNDLQLSSNPPSSLDITASLLYNNVVQPTYPQTGNLGSSLINHLSPLMKGDLPENNTYDGLAFSITKESISSFLCPNPNTEPEDDFPIIIDLPSSVYTHLHNENIDYNCNIDPPILSSFGISSTIINNTSGFIAENSTLFATPVELLIANDPYAEAIAMTGGINSSDLCERLRGTNDIVNGQQEIISINENLSFNLQFGTNAVSVGNSNRAWALCRFVDTDGNIISPSPMLNVDPTFLGQNGATLHYSSSNNQMLIHFANEPSTQLSIPILAETANQANCLPAGTQLEIVYGMFCKDVVSDQAELNSFFAHPQEYACFSCTRTIPIQQEIGINYTAESSILFENCKLKWEIDLENPNNNLSIINPSLRLVLPDGLLISSILPSNLIYTVSGATVIDGPPAPVSSVLDINLSNPIWESGTTQHVSIEFIFSSDLCNNMVSKEGTELSLYVFGISACDNSQAVQNIQIQGDNYPVQLSPGPIPPSCCAEIEANYTVTNSCPATSNGILSLTGVTFTTPVGELPLGDISICSLSSIDQFGNQTPVGLLTNTIIDDFTNVILGPGQYMLQINIPPTDFNPEFSLFEPFFVLEDNAACPCPCENLSSLTDIIVPPDVITSTQLALYLNYGQAGFSLSSRCIQLQNDLLIDNNALFSQCEFKIPVGRKIEIQNGGGNLLLNGCYLSGCEKLWEGIINNGQVTMNGGTTIEDAHTGYYINSLTQSIGNTTFKNCFVGIRYNPTVMLNSLSLNGITFSGGTLLPAYLGCNPAPLGHSFAGAVLSKLPELNMNNSTRFENLHNGLIASQITSLSVNGTTFENIGTQSIVNQGAYTGVSYWLNPIENSGNQQLNLASPPRSAIYSRDCDAVKIVGNSGNTPEFENIWNGITSVNDRNFNVSKTRLNNLLRVGITQISFYSGLSIIDNTINFTPNRGLAGIMIFNPSLNVTGKIHNNIMDGITSNNPWMQSSIRRGIFVSGNDGNTNLSVAYNRINNMHRGIWALNCRRLSSVYNKINLTGLYTSGQRGISFENCLGSSANCNTIEGNNLNFGTNISNSPQAINLTLSQQSSIQDNYLTGTSFGIFSRDNNAGSSVKLNRLNNHKNGIYISANSRIGHQFYSQNTFWGSFEKHAVDISLDYWKSVLCPNCDPEDELNPIPAPLFSTFRYGENQTGTAATLTIPSFPPNLCHQNYFYTCVPVYNAQLTSPCSYNNARYGQSNNEEETFNDSLLFDKTAKNELSFSEFNEEYTAKVKQYLASKKEILQNVLPDTGVYATLLYSIESGNESKLFETDLALNTVNVDTLLLNNLSDLSDSIDFHLNAIYNVDSLFNANAIDSVTHESTSQFHHDQLKQFQLAQKGELDYLHTTQNIPEAKLRNQSIEAELLMEQYEKTVNTIFLNNITEGKLNLDSLQFADLLLIAGTCPKIGGAAVFKARGIVSMYSDTTFADDEELCAQQGIQYRKGQTSLVKSESSLIRIYPNPAKNLLTVQVKLEEMELCIIKISNTLGQVIWQGMLSNPETILNHEISSLAPGTYFVEVYPQNREIRHIEKLIKL